ncbi:hypothetical protein [Streptomyces sp. NPDC057199]|uniref:hypothetical protein n=1 Tax=Streptomyces sp. NPDC057199 TaxID=3346047 RepID=UPI0036261989
MLARDVQVPLALVELGGGGEVGSPLVGLCLARLRLLVLGRGCDPEDLLAHPLLHGGELVEADPLGAYPTPEVFALAHDVARLGRQCSVVVQVLPGQVERALPLHGPRGAPRRVDLLQLVVPFVSVWDGGNLKSSAVATTCSYTWSMPGVKNDLREADVRFNTHDYDFTNKLTSSCSNKYDIRSVGTHEAGHVFGLGHVGSGHSNLTMYANSFTCKTIARTLGKGEVLALRGIY